MRGWSSTSGRRVTDPGYDVVTENRYFVATATDVEWEELSFSVNGTKWGADRPAFPLLQPEKVLSLPLQLRFDERYRYRLAGTETRRRLRLLRRAFDPVVEATVALPRHGLDRSRTFARVRVQAVQTRLSRAGRVERGDRSTIAPVACDRRPPDFLLQRPDAAPDRADRRPQPAGRESGRVHRLPRERRRLRRERGRRRDASDRIMFRETDAGLRYYVKEGRHARRQRSRDQARRRRWRWASRSIRPTPFRCRSSASTIWTSSSAAQNTQLALLFAGVLAAGNIQRPKSRRHAFDASVDFFAIAVPSSDRVYDASGEREAERC